MEERLIEFVKKNPFLYDKKSNHYQNIVQRDEKFAELSKKLNIPAKKLKERWRTLRDKFYKEIKTEISGRKGRTPKKKWKWMNQLMFLKDMYVRNLKKSSKVCMEVLTDCQALTNSPYPMELSHNPESIEDIKYELPLTPASDDAHLVEDSSSNVFTDHFSAETKQEISELVTLDKDYGEYGRTKTAAQLFFESLAKQVDDAKLAPSTFARLQMEILKTFNDVLYK